MLATTWCLATVPTTVLARSMPSTTSSLSWPSCQQAWTGHASGGSSRSVTVLLFLLHDTAGLSYRVLLGHTAHNVWAYWQGLSMPEGQSVQLCACPVPSLAVLHSVLSSSALCVGCCCRTAGSDRIKYLPTIYPHDSIIGMWQRGAEPSAAVPAGIDPAEAHCTLGTVTPAGRTAASAAAAGGGLRQRSRPQRA
jgi:hypothetical protein